MCRFLLLLPCRLDSYLEGDHLLLNFSFPSSLFCLLSLFVHVSKFQGSALVKELTSLICTSEFLILRSFWWLFFPFQIISNLWTFFLYCRYYTPENVLWPCLSTSTEYTVHLIWLLYSFTLTFAFSKQYFNSNIYNQDI